MKTRLLFLLGHGCLFVCASIPGRDPKSVRGYLELHQAGKTRPSEIAEIENAPGTLGHVNAQTFTVPPKLQERVNFWNRIYTEFSTNHGVLHDSEIPNLIYKVVDLSRVSNADAYIQNEKERIARQALSLQRMKASMMEINLPPFSTFRKLHAQATPERIAQIAGRIRMQLGQRDRIVRGFLSAGKYLTEMVDIFEQHRIPTELTRLPFVESAFNLDARSRVGASGIWQFMRDTGKQYLRIDSVVDERNDPIASTRAAAKFLRKNYEVLGSWPLAVTAYNHGTQGVLNAIRDTGTTDLATIIERYDGRAFGFASSNFYAEFLAILEVEREYRKHFGKIRADAPIKYRVRKIPKHQSFVELARQNRLEARTLWRLNPALTANTVRGKTLVPKGFPIKVPAS